MEAWKMERDIQKVLLSEEQIREKVKELGAQLMEEYADKNPVFVGVLKGVAVFFADMIRQFSAPCQIDFMWISSYTGTSGGEMIVRKDVSADLNGRHVVILEDIFDTGRSLHYTYNHLLKKNPASLRICTLLDKPERRDPAVTLLPDYTGFVIPNEFVVGYGLDYNEHYRNLPYVGILKPEVYEK
jgi:hypoxanthine phosphoribosyltransferase